MQTISVNIINEGVLRILDDLALLNLISIKNEKNENSTISNTISNYKGKMKKQTAPEIDKQFEDLRNEWI
jgi:hypothetical protein